MKKFYRIMTFILLAGLIGFSAGCGGSSTTKKTDSSTSDYPNGNLLASADDLKTSGTVIVDTRNTDVYAAGHIPGAINLRWQQFVDAGPVLKSVEDMAAIFGAAGISRSTRVIIYDDTINSWGAAGRMFWMLEYLGSTHVSILNGGWDKWKADGNTPETTDRTLTAVTFTVSVKSSCRADKAHVADMLDKSDAVVVDTRTDEEYIGWQLYGENRGGHIKGAVQIPYAWTYNSDYTVLKADDLKTLLESRGVTKDKEVTAYCTVGIRSGYFYFLTRLMGYEKTSNYDGSIKDWAADATLPMEKASRFSTIVHPAWVKALIDYHKPDSTSAAPPEYNYDRNHKYLIFETQWGTVEDDAAYTNGHIPGAIHSNSDTYENNYPRWFLLPDADLHAAMGTMGITADTTVVVYSNSPIFAARLWWILKYAGVTDVRFLNGGYEQWIKNGYDSETTVNTPAVTTFTGSVNPAFIATTDYVFAHYTDTATTLVADVRSADEYTGKKSGYSYLAAMGRIPGAVWALDGDDYAYNYCDADKTIRSYDEVDTLWKSLGITSSAGTGTLDKETIFYCGGGYRSALAFLYGYLMGYDNIRNYSDGWEGWSTTYTEDASCAGVTPGWCQDASGRPIVIDGE